MINGSHNNKTFKTKRTQNKTEETLNIKPSLWPLQESATDENVEHLLQRMPYEFNHIIYVPDIITMTRRFKVVKRSLNNLRKGKHSLPGECSSLGYIDSVHQKQ